MGLLREQCAEWRMAPLVYCSNRVWMKVGGQILWNVIPICETSKICYVMGKLIAKGESENHLKDLLFHLVHWLSITLSLRKTSQESINLERKFYLDRSSDTLRTRLVNLEGWRTGCRPWGVRNDGRIGNLLKKNSMRKRSFFPKKRKRRIYFPITDGRIKLSGRDQELRTSTLIRHRPIRGESHHDFLGESEGSLPPLYDSFPDAGEAINDFWSMSGNFIYRHHVEPGVKLYSPREESFPIPLKYTEVSRTHKLGCYARKTHRWLLEYRWVKRLVWSMDRFHSIYSIGRKTSRRIYVVREEINEKTADIQARSFMARNLGENEKECQAEGEAKVVEWKAPSWKRTKIARDLFHWPGG